MAFGHRPEGEAARDTALLRAACRILPVAPAGDGARLTTRISGRRYATPLLVLIIAIAVTDLAFAFDSIPAIFGLTRDPYPVFTANVFALLGLRHLYFLIGGLLGRAASFRWPFRHPRVHRGETDHRGAAGVRRAPDRPGARAAGRGRRRPGRRGEGG
jgi:Integral membrane protein TerC family